MHIVAIIQARMSSSRFPGKVLLDIAGEPMLARVVERARRARTVNQVMVATTTDLADDPVAAFCQQRGYSFIRGSLTDVLDRYYQAARASQADVIVRLTADCPVIDPDVIDATVSAFLGKADNNSAEPFIYDFVANRLPPPWKRTYPIGLDVEVCSFNALERAWKEADQPHQREHVMPFLYEKEGRFRIFVLDHSPDYGALRWTVDTPEDLELIRRIFSRFNGRDDFSWLEVLALFQREPELAQINAGVQHHHYKDVDARAKGK